MFLASHFLHRNLCHFRDVFAVMIQVLSDVSNQYVMIIIPFFIFTDFFRILLHLLNNLQNFFVMARNFFQFLVIFGEIFGLTDYILARSGNLVNVESILRFGGSLPALGLGSLSHFGVPQAVSVTALGLRSFNILQKDLVRFGSLHKLLVRHIYHFLFEKWHFVIRVFGRFDI